MLMIDVTPPPNETQYDFLCTPSPSLNVNEAACRAAARDYLHLGKPTHSELSRVVAGCQVVLLPRIRWV